MGLGVIMSRYLPPEASDIAPEAWNRTRGARKGLGDFNRAIQARWKGIVAGGGGLVGDGQGGFI
jgi:hypothetical protein